MVYRIDKEQILLHNEAMAYNWDRPIEIRDARNGEWFWVEKSVWSNTLLTSSDKVLYGTLAYFANGKTQEAFPSLKTLAEHSALSNRQIALSVKKLEENKYISIKRTSGKPNNYTLLKTRYAKFAGVQNNTTTYAKEHEVPMQNNTTNKNSTKELINKNYTSLSLLEEIDFQEVADKYQVPVAFVRSKYDDLVNYCGARGKQYKNYKLALADWVKKDAFNIRKEVSGRSKLVLINPK